MAKSENSMETQELKEPRSESRGSVAPFGIEIDHPRNCDVLLQSIPNARLRSTIRSSKTVKNAITGAEVIPQDQSAYLGQFPSIPGMQLHVNPADRTYKIIDPLATDEELCEKIRQAMMRTETIRSATKIKGVPPQEGSLDAHRMKTLVREMCWLVKANEAQVVRGSLPAESDVEALSGNFLLNPGSQVFNTQPRFEKDWDAWVEQLTAAGG